MDRKIKIFDCVTGSIPPQVGWTLFLQPDGKFMFYVGVSAGVYRFNPDGSFDRSIFGLGFSPSGIQPDQKIVNAASVFPDYTTIRLERRLLDGTSIN